MHPLITHNLSLKIKSQLLLDQINIELPATGVTMIMGANGAGKSLLLRVLHGLISPTNGSVKWGGQNISTDIRKRQAMIFQRPVLLRRSVAANIDFVLALRHQRSRRLRDQLLDDVGLLPMAKQPARLLSGGEQQRLALARALAIHPEVLFLDEPTANLDPSSVLQLEDIVQRQSNSKIIFITHDLGQARRLADDVVFLHNGKLQEHTPAGQFFENQGSTERSAAASAYLSGKLFV